ncbi:hypothetical protein A2154_04300 [Candidatus Gottesmanbacteria bacterium RBG_16_43_7]|uniref:Double Cache domain-containing protein n=1 Tax=Candidatus Gottesmanbacteria bacterium RBG_16_43_7 TaxID=1798373 RepID=A0A1F5ZAX0_9BACT|nr:MAG: hypothetical protein A2154_04300 [Candidatus Gottesmanbacteria bacterium RBG_16_43_7]
MWSQFYLINFHFAVNLFAALTFFAIFWLHFDAWILRKTKLLTIRMTAYAVLSLGFLLHATIIESDILTSPLFGKDTINLISTVLLLLGYLALTVCHLFDPILPRPNTTEDQIITPALILTGNYTLIALNLFLMPIAAVSAGFMYLRRATIGLEDHLKPVAIGLLVLAVSHLLSISVFYRQIAVPFVYDLTRAYGLIWLVEHLIFLVGIMILAKWIFGYLLKQFGTQLFMIFTIVTTVIFLTTTITFTGLLTREIERVTIRQLETDVKVLAYGLNAKKDQSLSEAAVIANYPEIVEGVAAGSRKGMAEILFNHLTVKKLNTLVVVDANGQVLGRGEDSERIGDSLSGDTLIKRAIKGETVSSVISIDGLTAPVLVVKAAVPIIQSNSVIGAVQSGISIDASFTEELKKTTGLVTAVYGGERISVSSLDTQDIGGLINTSKNVAKTVLEQGKPFSGSVYIGNNLFYGAYLPVTDINNTVIGMLFTGTPQIEILHTVGRSVELTFVLTIILLIMTIIPAKLISGYITRQIV